MPLMSEGSRRYFAHLANSVRHLRRGIWPFGLGNGDPKEEAKIKLFRITPRCLSSDGQKRHIIRLLGSIPEPCGGVNRRLPDL